jgi:hypothetical protein
MNSSVKVIKKDKNVGLTDVQVGQDERTSTQSTREVMRAVKGWIAELHRRRRDEELAASALRKVVTLPLIVLFILCVATESNCQQLREAFCKVEGTREFASALVTTPCHLTVFRHSSSPINSSNQWPSAER